MFHVSLKRPAGPGRWLRLYRLYRGAFPASERKPFGIIYKMYRRGKTDLWCLERDGEFAGLAATINSERLVLLDYFAVERRLRGQGIGSAAMEALQARYSGRGLFVEIESTRENAPNRSEREKRKRFYLASGLTELNTEARVFGVNMELLGSRCDLDFERYRAFYRDNYGPWAAEHIEPIEERA